jgi:hypothetical protein
MGQSTTSASSTDVELMHRVYREEDAKRAIAPNVVCADSHCPHQGCGQHPQAIDFRLEAFGRPVHDPLVKAWWNDVGFAGRCPGFGGWIHFTIRGKRAIGDAEASWLPQLPANWAGEAIIL